MCARRYLAVARRAGQWYAEAQKSDGGMFRHTDAQFQTSTFGQVSSGSACAAILWLELYSVTHDAGLLQLIERALRFVAGSQLANATNPELLNAVVENSNAPGRTDASPYHLRDIASSFYV